MTLPTGVALPVARSTLSASPYLFSAHSAHAACKRAQVASLRLPYVFYTPSGGKPRELVAVLRQ
jgi:hypothetical protein